MKKLFATIEGRADYQEKIKGRITLSNPWSKHDAVRVRETPRKDQGKLQVARGRNQGDG